MTRRYLSNEDIWAEQKPKTKFMFKFASFTRAARPKTAILTSQQLLIIPARRMDELAIYGVPVTGQRRQADVPWVFSNHQKPPRDSQFPRKPGQDEVLIKIVAAGLNPKDWKVCCRTTPEYPEEIINVPSSSNAETRQAR
jgi:hypothetical protein